MDGRGMMSEIVINDDPFYLAAIFRAALDAFKCRETVLDNVVLKSQSPGGDDRSECFLNIERSRQRDREMPNLGIPAHDVESHPVGFGLDVHRPPFPRFNT